MENKKLLPVVNKRLVNEPVNLHECCQSKLQFREVIRCATASQVDIMVKAMFSNTIGQREYLLEMLNCSYVIPVYLHDCVSTGIRYLATKNYSDEAIDRMVKKPLCLADCLSSLGSINDGDISLEVYPKVWTVERYTV